MKTMLTLCLALVTALPLTAPAQPIVDRALAIEAFKHSDYGLRFLRSRQAQDGSWSGSVTVTALALRAFLESYQGYNEADGAFITRPVAFLLARAREDGSIGAPGEDPVDSTAAAVIALRATGNPAHGLVIANALRFLEGTQIDEDDGVSRAAPTYGAIAAEGGGAPALSRQTGAIEALHRGGLDAASPTWEKALHYVGRLQAEAAADGRADGGGYAPRPGASPRPGSTYTGLAALLLGGAGKDDPRVQAAWGWIRTNYALDFEGMDDVERLRGLATFAKAMRATGESLVQGTDGTSHNWRNDLITKVLALYNPDGSWGAQQAPEAQRDLATAWAVIALDQMVQSLR